MPDDREQLENTLRRIDGRPYPAYRDLEGRWRVGDSTLYIDHVQGDPFAAPSRVRLRVPCPVPESIVRHPDRAMAAEDWLLRRFARGLRGERRGSGRSGLMEVYRPGPEVVERSALRLWLDGTVEVRFRVGLPARSRRILGRAARDLLLGDVFAAAEQLAIGPGFDEHVQSVARQGAMRRALSAAGLVAFIENGSVLPRESGVDQGPLDGAVPFQSPPSLEVTLETPFGPVAGMGVRRGVTVITGGGFHGKSTVLQALEHGHLDHVPGDGREGVVALSDTVKVRAEDGRSVCGVDIRPFLRDLPGGRRTDVFHTDDASGSTSQAAAMIESVEAGARVLLIDEDTSATNLLVRDARMRALIPREGEPITPFVERVRQMVDAWDVSTVMVIGGVGDYLGVADTVVLMDAYRPRDVTQRARELGGAPVCAETPLRPVGARVLSPRGLDVRKVRARTPRAVDLDKQELDLTGVSPILDAAHAASIGHAIRWLAEEGLVDGRRDLGQILDAYEAILDDHGVECLSPYRSPAGFLVRPRRHEVAAGLARWRRLQLA